MVPDVLAAWQLHDEDISPATDSTDGQLWSHCVATTCEIVRSCCRQGCLARLLHSCSQWGESAVMVRDDGTQRNQARGAKRLIMYYCDFL